MSDEEIPIHTDHFGPYGTMQFVPHVITRPEHQAHLCTYLITAPAWHPVWSQYMLGVVSLKEYEGVRDPILQFEGATHEILVVALNPDHKQTVETMLEHGQKGNLPYLTPVNISHQFEATDDEMEKLAWLCGHGVVTGMMNPETSDAPTRIRESWLSACVKTLAHFRGEEHSAH